MALQTTGFNVESASKLMLDAGAFYENLIQDETTKEWSGTLLGATQGGGEFNATPNIRQIQIDGIKGKAKGLSVIDNWDVFITANLLEVSTETLQLSLVSTIVDDTDTDYTKITAKNNIIESDYLTNVAYVGKISGKVKPVIIIVKNTINTEGITVKTEDSKEGILPVKFEGHYDASNLDTPPFEIYYPKIAQT